MTANQVPLLIIAALSLVLINVGTQAHGEDEPHHHSHKLSQHHHHQHSQDDYDGEASNELENEHYGEDGEHNDEFDHEAVIGSKAEAELFHSLTPEEAKQRLAEIVKKIDTNLDGVVNEQELRVWLKQNLRKLDVEAAEIDFAKHDTDGNKILSWSEYVMSQYRYSVQDIEKLAAESATESRHFLDMVEDDRARWTAADVNKDGELDLPEFVAFLSPFNYEHMKAYEVDRVLGQFDDSGDGSIDVDEFAAHEAGGELDEEARLSIAEQFRELDKNTDGHLERSEIGDWVAPGLDDSADLEARHLIETTNIDSNENELTLDEILDHYNLWVGSQDDAQDYLDTDEEDQETHTEL